MRAIGVIVAATLLNSAAVFGQGVNTNSVVYEQLPLHNIALDSDGAEVRWAAGIQLPQTTLIRSIIWWGADSDSRQSSSGNFSLTLYSDDSGKPDGVIPGFSLAGFQAFATGETVESEYPEFAYVGLLQQPFEFRGGARYWLSIANPPVNTWLWEASDEGAPGYVQVNGGPWVSEPLQSAAFALSTDVSEVPSLLLVFIGIAGVWICEKRRTSSEQGIQNPRPL